MTTNGLYANGIQNKQFYDNGFTFENGEYKKPIRDNIILKRDPNKAYWNVDHIKSDGSLVVLKLDEVKEEEILEEINSTIAKVGKPWNPGDAPQERKEPTGYVSRYKSKVPATPSKIPTLPAIQQKYDFSDRQIQAIKDTVAKGASDSEFEMLMYLANRYQLDPILKEIFYSPQMKTIMTSRDGYLKIAQRSPEFEGIQSMAVCENDDFEIDVANHTVIHKFGKGDRGDVIGAWAIVYRKGRHPVVAYAPYKEHASNNPAWKYKSAMCCKCAESFALKRQFSISGLVTQEELGFEDINIIDAEFVEEATIAS